MSRRLALLVLCSVTACTGPGLLTDGSSVSHGTTSYGALRDGVTLPPHGDGYYIPQRWRDRQRNYGTDELVELLVRATRRVNLEHRGALIGIADLSPQGGGPTLEHKSHRSGRDADLLFYYTDEKGKPVKVGEMIEVDEDGVSVPPATQPASSPTTTAEGTKPPASQPSAPPPLRKLDVERTWALVKALVLDPRASVQWIFIGRPLSRLLLHHARRNKEPSYVIERAATVLHHTRAHMDHFHVRVFCDAADRALGCIDRGPPRWLKKEIKYIDTPPPPAPLAARNALARLLLRPLRLIGR